MLVLAKHYSIHINQTNWCMPLLPHVYIAMVYPHGLLPCYCGLQLCVLPSWLNCRCCVLHWLSTHS